MAGSSDHAFYMILTCRATYIRMETQASIFPSSSIVQTFVQTPCIHPACRFSIISFVYRHSLARTRIMRSALIPLAAALVGSAAAWPHPESNSTVSSSLPTVTSSGTAGTETMTTYTTVTTCPVTVTQTSGSSIAVHTTLTTSTVTVTSCKHGCHPPTPVPTGDSSYPGHGDGVYTNISSAVVPAPTNPGAPTVLTSTLTSFVPTSTLLASNGAEYYSTWLATTHLTTHITTHAAAVPTPETPAPATPEVCPPAETIYKTVYLPAPSAGSSSGGSGSSGPDDCVTYTLTLPNGSTTTAVITVPGTPSATATTGDGGHDGHDGHDGHVGPTGTGGHAGPTGTSGGHGGAQPSGTGAYSYSVPQPTDTGAPYGGYSGRVRRSWFF